MRGEVGEPAARGLRHRRCGQSPRQISKSAAMRTLALETTIQCLAERPYSEVSLATIAEKGGLSRGGVQYHFPTRLDLLKATVDFLHQRQLENFRDDLASRPADRDLFDHMIETRWARMGERDFRAYQELVLASRCEPELAEALGSSHRAFIRAWQDIARASFGWDEGAPAMAQAGSIAHCLLDGMAFGRIAGRLSQEETGQLLGYVKAILRQAAQGAVSH